MSVRCLLKPIVSGVLLFTLNSTAAPSFSQIWTWDQDPSIDSRSGRPVKRVVNTNSWTYEGGLLSSHWAETYVDALRSTEKSGYAVKQTNEAVNAVHTLAVVTETHDQWASNLERLISQEGMLSQHAQAVLTWAEKRAKVTLFPSYMEEQNAYFAPDAASSEGSTDYSDAIVTGWYKEGSAVRHTCRSAEIVAHESGHRCHFLTHPESQTDRNWDTEVGAFGEGYGDFRAFVYNVNNDFSISRIMEKAKGDMSHPAFWRVADLAEQFGHDLGYGDTGLRSSRLDFRMPASLQTDFDNADRDLRISSTEIHDLGRVWNTAVYDVVATQYGKAAALDRNYRNEATPLIQEITNGMDVLVSATLLSFGALNPSPSFKDVATAMYRLVDQGLVTMPYGDTDWQGAIAHEFGRRGVLVDHGARALNSEHFAAQHRRHADVQRVAPSDAGDLMDLEEDDGLEGEEV